MVTAEPFNDDILIQDIEKKQGRAKNVNRGPRLEGLFLLVTSSPEEAAAFPRTG